VFSRFDTRTAFVAAVLAAPTDVVGEQLLKHFPGACGKRNGQRRGHGIAVRRCHDRLVYVDRTIICRRR
jgi:hypothetical protein